MDEQGTPHWAQPQIKRSKQKVETEMGYPGGIARHHLKAEAKTREGCEVQEELL